MKTIINSLTLTPLFMCLLFTTQINAQVYESTEVQRQKASEFYITPFDEKNIQGSPFFMDDFVEGSIILKNDKPMSPIQLRINTYSDVVEAKDGSYIFTIEHDDIQQVNFSTSASKHTFKNGFKSSGLNPNKLVLVLADGHGKFIVNYSTDRRQTSFSNFSNRIKHEFSKFVTNETYYVKFGEEETKRLRRLNERRIMHEFPTHVHELETFAENNDIHFSNPDDVTRLFNYYNELIE